MEKRRNIHIATVSEMFSIYTGTVYMYMYVYFNVHIHAHLCMLCVCVSS